MKTLRTLASLALFSLSCGAYAASPLPANTLLFNSDHEGGNHEIYRMDLATQKLQKLTNDPTYDASWARMSPDRTRILFQRTQRL